MSFLTIPDSWITVGAATAKRLFLRIKDNLDDHETRLNSVEGGINKQVLFSFEVTGFIADYSVAELRGISTYKASSDSIITEVKLTLLNSSSTPAISSSLGALSIDLERSQDNGATWSSILVQKPTIGDGKYLSGEESALVSFISGGEILLKDDLIRVSVVSKKDSQGSFLILVYSENS